MPERDAGTAQSRPQIPERLYAVGPGWHLLLSRLHTQVSGYHPGYRLGDLREKLGGLRVRLDGAPGMDALVRAALVAAETEASVTCEFCGAPGHTHRRGDVPSGWAKTVCDSCHTEWSEHRLLTIHGTLRRRPANPGRPIPQ